MSHLSVEELAELDAGVGPLEKRQAHVARCAACRQRLDSVAHVTQRLAALPPVALPPEVAARLDAALAAAPRPAPPGRDRGRALAIGGVAAAAVVVVVAGAVALFGGTAPTGGERGANSTAGRAQSALPTYDAASLPGQVEALLRGSMAAAPRTAEAPAEARTAGDACLAALGRPLAVGDGIYAGRPVRLVVLARPGDRAHVDALLIRPACPASAADVVYRRERLPR